MSPTISMFFGIIIKIHWEKGEPHHAAHIHAEYQDYNAVFAIPSGKILDGRLPRRQRNFVRAWISLHEDELMANWKLTLNDEQPFRIAPLK